MLQFYSNIIKKKIDQYIEAHEKYSRQRKYDYTPPKARQYT